MKDNLIISEIRTHDYSCNRYLVYRENLDQAIVIDPGLDASLTLEELKKVNKKLGAILLTHAHYDHIESVAELKSVTKAPVFMGEKDVELLYNGGHLDWYFAKTLKPFMVDNRLIDGDIEICGIKIGIIPTPGHTQGSLTFVIEDNMFTGDAIFYETYGRTDLIGSDFSQLVDSAKRLFAVQGEYKLFCGHGKNTTISHERECNPILKLF